VSTLPDSAKAKATSRPSAKTPATKATRTYHHGDLRRALIDATKEIVESTGPESFTLREAARRAGVNHRAAYRHFADKSDVLVAVAEEGFLGLYERLVSSLANVPERSSEKRLLAIARAYVEFASENRGTYRVMSGPRLNEEGTFPALEEAITKNLVLVQREIEAGIALGKLRKTDPFDATLALWSAVHGLSSLVLMRRVKVRPALVGELSERLLGGLLAGFVKRK
jgi:AcrR family transcriptional regulator